MPRLVAARFRLLTHSGIDELGFGGSWCERVGGRLDDGSGNPPPGWGNPFQVGSLTIDGTQATFADLAGHRETFTMRPGATTPKLLCD